MQQYPREKQYWEQSDTERALHAFQKEVAELKEKLAKNDLKSLTSRQKTEITTRLNLQLNHIRQLGDLDVRLERFRKRSAAMNERKLRWERHYSQRLGRNLRLAGKPQPDGKCHAHALIAGSDPAAGRMRALLAMIGIRVDDAFNGVWLPGYEDDLPHWAMPNAVAHAWLNHPGYHRWLEQDRFGRALIRAADTSVRTMVAAVLQRTALMLQKERHNIPKKAIQTKSDTAKRRYNKK